MIGAVVLLALAAPAEPVRRVDTIERNHVCNEVGIETLDQVIIWNWDFGSRHVDGWRFWKCVGGLRPTKYGWRCRIDGKVIEARHYVETWSMRDREIEDQDEYPTSWRRGL